jgi:adenylosuccinate synthase
VSLVRQGNTCVFGLQWGDEGKGKIVDLLTEQADVVARYCGGANAGHTVRFNGQRYSTHLLPVGIFRPHVMNIIGNGVVLDPEALFAEIDDFVAKGCAISPQNLRVSYKAHIVMPYHKAEDGARESAGGAARLGTTRRGIGPAYADKMQRSTALRVCDLLHEASLKDRIVYIVEQRNKVLGALYDLPPLDGQQVFAACRDLGRRIAPFVDDSTTLLLDAAKAGNRIVFEGAHAALLDVDHGTYPFVTSSNCSALGLFTGVGVPPSICRNYVGILKAYTTRVGDGPFPTEQDNDTGNYIRQRGDEYGSTTRRPRRCGWYDAVAVKYSVDLCGVTEIVMTMLDVLTGLDELRICTGYQRKGTRLHGFRADIDVLAEVEPIYETLPGWRESIGECRKFEDLPREARNYVERIEQLAGAPIRTISVGADRAATLFR